MSTDDEEIFKLSNELDGIFKVAKESSIINSDRIVSTWRAQYAADFFTKIVLHTNSFLKILPTSEFYSSIDTETIWDLPSLCVLTRATIDTYYAMYYLCIEEIDTDESEFRKHLWHFHGNKRRLEKLILMNSSNSEINKIQENADVSLSQIEDTSFFKSLTEKEQKKVRRAESALWVSNSKLSEKIGVSKNLYRITFKFLSAYVHAYPFAISQMQTFNLEDKESKSTFRTVINYLAGYLSLSLVDFFSVSTVCPIIDNRTREAIDIKIHIMKNLFHE